MILLAAFLAAPDYPEIPRLPEPAAFAMEAKDALAEKEALRLTLADLRRDQERGFEGRDVGGVWLEFAAGVDPVEKLWVKVRGASRQVRAFNLAELKEGFSDNVEGVRFRFIVEDGTLRVTREDNQHTHAHVSLPQLIRGLHTAALHVLLGTNEYAVVKQDFPLPDAVALIKEEITGQLRVTYFRDEELGKTLWFLYNGGLLYGMKLDGTDLVFTSKPATAEAAFFLPSPYPLPLALPGVLPQLL